MTNSLDQVSEGEGRPVLGNFTSRYRNADRNPFSIEVLFTVRLLLFMYSNKVHSHTKNESYNAGAAANKEPFGSPMIKFLNLTWTSSMQTA